MNPVYFDTRFECAEERDDWPAEFSIVTAYATTGQKWSDSKNRSGDRKLEAELRGKSLWIRRLTGYSPATGHREPGWAVGLGLSVGCDLGLRYRQDAIYYVSGDDLGVSFCDLRRALVKIGSFRRRLDIVGLGE